MMGFLPFVNDGGRRVVRWPRLILMWVAIILASSLGFVGASYALDWWDYTLFGGIAMGVCSAAWATTIGFTLPVEKLPHIR